MNLKSFIASSLLLSSLAIAEPYVKTAGLSIVFDSKKEEFNGLSTLNQFEAINMALHIDLGGAPIISLNENNSKISKLSDDTGKDLEGSLWSFPLISKDKKLMRIQVKGGKTPAPSAKTLNATGSISIYTAEESKKLKSKLVTAKEGETISFSGKLRFTVKKVGKPDWGDEPQQIELQIKRDIPEVAKIAFYDQDNRLIETKEGGTSRMTFGNSLTLSKSYRLNRKVESFYLEAEVWTDMKEVNVPINVSSGIGGN